MSKKASKPPAQLYAMKFSKAVEQDSISRFKGYELVKRGEWQSYLDGGVRMVTVASIEARRARLIAETGDGLQTGTMRGWAESNPQ